MPAGGDKRPDSARRRLRGFRTHIMIYFAIMVVLVLVNYLTTPATPWFLLTMVGWGSVLALHAAWALGLYDGFRKLRARSAILHPYRFVHRYPHVTHHGNEQGPA